MTYTQKKIFLKISLILGLFFFPSCISSNHKIIKKSIYVKVKLNNIIKKVPLEKYVAGVLAGEVASSWPLEALKAQAVAARTYVLKKISQRKNNSYHVEASVADQVYKNKTKKIFIQAARETQNLVLFLNNKLAQTSFHSTCGGHTASSKHVWGTNYSHLTGTPCSYCKISPSYNWSQKISSRELENIFKIKLTNIKIVSYFADKRINKIKLIGDKNIILTAHDFRMKISPMKIKSTKISQIQKINSSFLFTGNGFGHGVGLCQYGALGLAKTGKKFNQILNFYYPHTKIKKLRN